MRVACSFRFILGLLNGIMPAVRTTVHEVCGPEHVVMGLAYVGGETHKRYLYEFAFTVML